MSVGERVGRLLDWTQAFSVRVKIMGLAVGMVLLMGLGASLLAQSAFLRSTSAELERRGVSIASDVAARGADLLLTHNLLGLQELVLATLQNNEDVRYIVVLDARHRVAAHTFTGGFPTDLLRLPFPAPGERARVELVMTEEGLLHDVAVPILGGSAGTVRVGMSPQRLRREAMDLAHRLSTMILLVAGVALAGAYLLTQVLTRPILQLAEVAKEAAAHNLSRRAPPGPPDEIGVLTRAFNEMLDRLQESQRVKDELLDRVIAAQEEERRRIARELHDETGQSLTSLIVGLKALEEAHPEARDTAAELRRQAAATLDEIHTLILALRPRALDELGLVPALRRFVSDFSQKHGIRVDFQTLGDDLRLPARVETCLYRIVQEALTNVARHARARAVSVVIDVWPHQVSAVIEDDGVGFDPNQVGGGRLGLAGMRERAALFGGQLRVESSPGGGTTVAVKIPLE
ncbi:histidine kinase [Caldinitratiruptor microaerophilus]|uniref:Oxygen sensor histidine kinase NreB n=1 Tax=Caldinitratiruptor microaerophilus TaxID=671077 RepID=A0AA35CIZ9_9FIRM|nr:histidine kinase [Caldinitratiruptor microaerophilus]